MGGPDPFGRIARLHGMTDAAWARHANPLSVWTRIPVLPLLVLAVWARAWIGPWCLLPVALLILWTAVNPRVFPPPARLDGWASRGVLGERVFLARRERPIPRHQERAAIALSAAALAGLPVIVYGLIVLDGWATLAGTLLSVGAKLWFVDRMVWLHDETAGRLPAPARPGHA